MRDKFLFTLWFEKKKRKIRLLNNKFLHPYCYELLEFLTNQNIIKQEKNLISFKIEW